MTTDSNPSLRWFDFFGGLLLVTATVLFVVGILRMQSNAEDVMQWLPDQSEERQVYQFFEEQFQSDDFVIVTWDGCTADDPRLARFASALREEPSAGGLIQSVQTGPEVAQRLVDEIRVTPAQARSRLSGFFFGVADPELTCTLVELTLDGTHDRPAVIEAIWQSVDRAEGLQRDDVIMGGYPYIATYLDDQVNSSLTQFLFPSFVLATLVSWICLRDFRLAGALFIGSGLAAALSLAFIPLCGVKFSGLTSIIPTLAFVMTNSGGLHLIRYNLTCIGQPAKLLAIAWRPCLISTATTAIGMLSLTRSEFPAIRDFGLFCAAGVGFSFLFQMAVIPWLLTRLGQSGLQAMATRTDEGHAWQRFLNMISRRKLAIVSVSLVIVLLTLFGLSRLRARVEVDGLFADDAPVIQSLRDLERRLGALDQIELLFVFEDCQPSDFYRRVDYIRGMQIALTEDTAFKQAYSLANYLPSRPRLRSGGRSITEQTLYRRLLGEQRENLGNSSFLKINEAQEVWRVMLRIPFTAQADFDDLRSDVLDVADKYNQNYQQFDPDLKTVLPIYTGKLFLYNSAQKELLYDLFLNFLLAFVIITPLMIVVLRSLSMGLIAMIPNVMPMLIVFGGMGLIDLPVDIAIAMTASVALGIAVDDTAHFLIRFREFGGRLFQLSPAMEKTIDQCGPAMLYTTLMSGAGIFVSYFSQLQVVSRFAATLTLLLFIALLADVVLLPAILFVLGRGARNSQIPGPLAGVSFPPSVDDVERS